MNPTLLSLKCVCRTSITRTTASSSSSNFKLGCTLHPLEFITEMLREPLACVSVSPVFIQFSICDHFLCYMLIPIFFLYVHLNDFTSVMVCFISIIYPMACLFYFICFSVSVTIPPPINARTRSCPMVLTTTVRPIPHTCIATGEAWGQGQALPSPSSLLPPPHPPPLPPAPPVHGHVPPQPCFQTTLTTARWGQWCLHHESPAGRFVHHLDLDDPSSL